MRFDRGYLSPCATSSTSQKLALLTWKTFILLADKKISNIREMLPVLEAV